MNEVNYTNATALYKAVEAEDWKTALSVLQSAPHEASTWVYKMEADEKTLDWKVLPLHAAVARDSPPKVIYNLLAAYADGARSRHNSTSGDLPIHYAVQWGSSVQIIKILLVAYPDGITEKDSRGLKPADVARSLGKSEMLEALEKGAQHYRVAKTEKQRDEITATENGPESFKSFIGREIGSQCSSKVRALLAVIAEKYINGCDTTTMAIHALSVALNYEGKIHKSAEGKESNGHSGKNEASDSDMEQFRTDMAGCLTEIIYEYLSENWNQMDELIKMNSAPKDGEPPPSATAVVVKASKWELVKKHVYRMMIMEDMALSRNVTTMAAILKSVKLTEPTPEVKHAREVLFASHAPTIVFLGGGMGAGKSTVVALLKKKQEGVFAEDPLIVEADALKMIDPVFKKLNEVEAGSNDISQVVHNYSTDAANTQLLVALQNQRTIVMDGTMTWMPYVQQTIDMVRNAHKFQYVLGPGYVVNDDGTTTEEYWKLQNALSPNKADGRPRVAYKIEMVGVTVDPEKAVARGLRRKLITSRGVPVEGQLRSHRLYSNHFEPYLNMFDRSSLYDTSGLGDPQLVAVKEKGQPLLTDPVGYSKFLTKKTIQDGGGGVRDMYGDGTQVTFDRPYWTDVLKTAFS